MSAGVLTSNWGSGEISAAVVVFVAGGGAGSTAGAASSVTSATGALVLLPVGDGMASVAGFSGSLATGLAGTSGSGGSASAAAGVSAGAMAGAGSAGRSSGMPFLLQAQPRPSSATRQSQLPAAARVLPHSPSRPALRPAWPNAANTARMRRRERFSRFGRRLSSCGTRSVCWVGMKKGRGSGSQGPLKSHRMRFSSIWVGFFAPTA